MVEFADMIDEAVTSRTMEGRDGATVEVNLRLLHQNAALAARVARALAPRGTGVPA